MVENYDYAVKYYDNPGYPYKVKYPVNITWEEISSGGFVSDEIIEGFGIKEYFVFGESGIWGKYDANDDIINCRPLHMLGFSKAYTSLFVEKFKNYLDEDEELKAQVKSWLPPAYKPYDKYL